jgi:hypothetical protein
MGFEPVALSQDGGVVQFGPESLGLDVPSALQGVAIAEDGTVWTVHVGRADLTTRATMDATMDDEGRVLGLAAFDGETWRYVPYEGSARGTGNSPAPFVGPDGTIWVAIPDDEGVPAAVGWDGDEWVELGPESGHIVGYPNAQPLPDGRTLFPGPAILDGSTFRRWDPLRLERRDNAYGSLSAAPDGSVWVVAWEWEPDGDRRTPHFYVITPEAVVATE